MKNYKGEIATLLTLGLVLVGTLITLGTSLFVSNKKTNLASNSRATLNCTGGEQPCSTVKSGYTNGTYWVKGYEMFRDNGCSNIITEGVGNYCRNLNPNVITGQSTCTGGLKSCTTVKAIYTIGEYWIKGSEMFKDDRCNVIISEGVGNYCKNLNSNGAAAATTGTPTPVEETAAPPTQAPATPVPAAATPIPAPQSTTAPQPAVSSPGGDLCKNLGSQYGCVNINWCPEDYKVSKIAVNQYCKDQGYFECCKISTPVTPIQAPQPTTAPTCVSERCSTWFTNDSVLIYSSFKDSNNQTVRQDNGNLLFPNKTCDGQAVSDRALLTYCQTAPTQAPYPTQSPFEYGEIQTSFTSTSQSVTAYNGEEGNFIDVPGLGQVFLSK